LRILVAGWFSIEDGGATAGDVLVRDVACEWLDGLGIPYDVANEPSMGPGVDWFRVSPKRYTHLVFACGPVGRDLAVAQLIERFAGSRRIGLNVSIVGDHSWRPFDVMIERDGRGRGRPDLSILAPRKKVPVVARLHIHRQAEYPTSRVDEAHRAFDRLLAGTPAAAFEIDTPLHPEVPGRRSAAEVESLLARADIALTTRLHGLVLALANGVPAVAVDAVPGGAKVLAQAKTLGWPAALAVDEIGDRRLAELFEWCLGDEAHERVAECMRAARDASRAVGHELARAVGGAAV